MPWQVRQAAPATRLRQSPIRSSLALPLRTTYASRTPWWHPARSDTGSKPARPARSGGRAHGCRSRIGDPRNPPLYLRTAGTRRDLSRTHSWLPALHTWAQRAFNEGLIITDDVHDLCTAATTSGNSCSTNSPPPPRPSEIGGGRKRSMRGSASGTTLRSGPGGLFVRDISE